MSEEDDSGREFEPTPHKLAEARKKGDLVRSADLAQAAGYGAVLIVAMGLGAQSLLAFGAQATVLLDQADSLSKQFFGGGVSVGGAVMFRMILPILPWFFVPAVAVILVYIAQNAVVFATDKLIPKGNRINPIANAGQKFGRSGLFEFAKSFVKLVVIAIILGAFLFSRIERIIRTQLMGVEPAIAEMMRILIEFLTIIVIIAVIIGAIDYLWQRMEFMRRNMMSRKELMDEMKGSEGDPHIKAQRRQKAQEIATRQMIGDVKKADVVIVNPTHYAVALKWDRAAGRAPVCVGKGVDEVAARIRAAAMEAGVPIHPDPPTARALHKALDIGDEISPEHYKAVAAAVRFAARMRKLAKERRGY